MGSSKLHVVLFPWHGIGHLISYVHFSNKLAAKGHKVSYLLAKGVIPKLEQLNHHPHLIHFVPLVIPHVDGLPQGAESASDVPVCLHEFLFTALEKTRDQVEIILTNLKPDIVLFDVGRWIPPLTHQLGITSIYYSVVSACTLAFFMVPSKRITPETTFEEHIQPPPGYPSSTVVIKRKEAPFIFLLNDPRAGSIIYDRITGCLKESDAIAFRSCHEMERPFCDYLAQQYSKPVLVTGHVLPETPATMLEEKWNNWLNKFEPGSVVYCAFGSQMTLEKKQFQELVLGFELSGLPFLVALTPPHGCSTIEEALPEGFEERVGGRGRVYGGWVSQTHILAHSSVGCFVSHCGFGSFWESLVSDCQIVLIPFRPDQAMGTRLMVEELKVAIEVERGEDGIIGKESLSKAIKSVMDNDSEVGNAVKNNHVKWRNIFCSKDWQDEQIDTFIRHLELILESKKAEIARG